MSIHEVFPYLRVRNCEAAINYYCQVFGATEKFRIQEASGRIGHCELDFGHGHVVMLSEEYPELGILGPESIGGASVGLHLHVDNADTYIERAVKAGGKLLRGPFNAPHGERSGTVRDPFGHEWMLGHTIEVMTPEEMKRRYAELEK
jgi:PhnB protein